MGKVKVGILGTGNIGTDLLFKIQRSKILECGIFAGINPESKGMEMAQKMGIKTSLDSINAIRNDPNCCEIVFDATSAKTHYHHAPTLRDLGKYTINMTPLQTGKMVIPVINREDVLNESSVNLITCGGQCAVPIAYAISKIHPETKYIEVVASIASDSAGPGTRVNIDEFTQITRDSIIHFTGVPKAKAIIILNPAKPPVQMCTTIYAQIENPKVDKLRLEIETIEKKLQKYVPGYKVILGPVAESGRVTTMVKVVGLGDYLPTYAGNLDIITCAAVDVAEGYASRNLL